MLRLVAAPAYDVFGVGDDDQVIYGYAGADPEFLIDYDRYFPGARAPRARGQLPLPAPMSSARRANLLGVQPASASPRTIRRRQAGGRRRRSTTARHAPEQLAACRARAGRASGSTAGAAPGDIAVLGRVRSVLLGVQLLLGAGGHPVPNAPVGIEVLEPHRHAHRARVPAARGRRRGRRARRARPRDRGAPAEPLAAPRAAATHRRAASSWRRQRVAAALAATGQRPARRVPRRPRHARRRELARAPTPRCCCGSSATTIGLGGALETLDRGGQGPEASHRDDLNALHRGRRARARSGRLRAVAAQRARPPASRRRSPAR